MKKNILTVVFGFVALFFVATSANAQNDARLDDYAYQMAKLQKGHYTDNVVYTVGDDPHEYTAGSMAKHGAYFGVLGGVQSFDGHVVPFLGGDLGWDGKHLGFEYQGTFAKGDYTEDADRNNPYVEFNSRLVAKVKVLANKKQSWQLWLDAYGSYKLNFDYHENSASSTTIKETDDKIITTIEKLGSNYEVKASTMGYGVQLELVHRPYMSKWNFRFFGGFGQQQRFYEDGNRFHPEAFGGMKITFNFNAKSMWDKNFLKKNNLTKRQAKKLAKRR